MNRSLGVMLLFRHDGPQRRGRQSQAQTPIMSNRLPQEGYERGYKSDARLATSRSLDHDEIDGTARPVIVEQPDRQPPGFPGGGVEVGAALGQ
jgi:hypothetical protein